MNLQPTEDRVVIVPAEPVTTSAGGIIIPEGSAEKPAYGAIVAIGPGRRDDMGAIIPMDLAVGDRVYYAKYAGAEITHGGDKYMVLRAGEVIAVDTGAA